MDIETAQAIDTLRVDVYHVDSSLQSQIDKAESTLRAEMRKLHSDAKRHADIIGESLHDDIRMLAEAVVSLTEKIDQRGL
jgi:hypothetical protein